MNRVAVTGLGFVSPLGSSNSDLVAALQAGRSGIGPLANMPLDGLVTRIGAQVRDFDPAAHFPDNKLALLDRCSQFALVAAGDAIGNSGLAFANELGTHTAVVIGCGVGGQNTQDESYRRLYHDNAKRLHPLVIPKLMISAPAAHITMAHGITGPSFTVASACASANHAIGIAFHMVRSGSVEVAVTGGTEATFTFGTMKGWEALRVMAPDTCRPFSKDRKGMVLGEGAAILVLENWTHAAARGADILAEIVGFGMSSDAGDIVAPAVEGAARAMTACLADARLAPEAVDYVNAHGTGTVANDLTETRALHRVFGDHARRLAVSSTKSMHGHALGAAGAIEMAATIAALRRGFLPPTISFTEADPQCDLDYVPNEAREQRVGVALSNSFAFGGHNAVLAIRL